MGFDLHPLAALALAITMGTGGRVTFGGFFGVASTGTRDDAGDEASRHGRYRARHDDPVLGCASGIGHVAI